MLDKFRTFMRVLTSKDGDLMSHFDKIKENQAEVNNTSLNHMLIDNKGEANRGKIKSQINLEHIFGFSSSVEKNYQKLKLSQNIRNCYSTAYYRYNKNRWN